MEQQLNSSSTSTTTPYTTTTSKFLTQIILHTTLLYSIVGISALLFVLIVTCMVVKVCRGRCCCCRRSNTTTNRATSCSCCSSRNRDYNDNKSNQYETISSLENSWRQRLTLSSSDIFISDPNLPSHMVTEDASLFATRPPPTPHLRTISSTHRYHIPCTCQCHNVRNPSSRSSHATSGTGLSASTAYPTDGGYITPHDQPVYSMVDISNGFALPQSSSNTNTSTSTNCNRSSSSKSNNNKMNKTKSSSRSSRGKAMSAPPLATVTEYVNEHSESVTTANNDRSSNTSTPTAGPSESFEQLTQVMATLRASPSLCSNSEPSRDKCLIRDKEKNLVAKNLQPKDASGDENCGHSQVVGEDSLPVAGQPPVTWDNDPILQHEEKRSDYMTSVVNTDTGTSLNMTSTASLHSQKSASYPTEREITPSDDKSPRYISDDLPNLSSDLQQVHAKRETVSNDDPTSTLRPTLDESADFSSRQEQFPVAAMVQPEFESGMSTHRSTTDEKESETKNSPRSSSQPPSTCAENGFGAGVHRTSINKSKCRQWGLGRKKRAKGTETAV